MAAFSASDAALEGFQVLRKHWRVAVGWALLYLVLAVAAVVASVIIGVTLVEVGAVAQDAVQRITAPVVGFLVFWVVPLVIATGVYRLMLRPEESGFLHLRIGADEVRMLCVWVLLLAALFAGSFAISALVAAVSKIAGLWLQIPIGVASFAILWLGLVRLGLAQATVFVDRRIDLRRPLRIGRGYSWALFGASLITGCLLALIFVATWIVLFLLGGALTGFRDLGLSDVDSFEAHPGRYLLQGAAEFVLTPAFLIIAHAPVVAAYKAVTAKEHETRTTEAA